MKLYCLSLCILLLSITYRSSAKNTTASFLKSTILIADSTTAAKFAGTPDSYTHNFSNFDLQGKIGKVGKYTEEDYLKHAAKNMRTWSDKQIESILQSMSVIANFIKEKQLQFDLPDTILIIKTNAGEEFGADGYTRGNAILLNAKADPVHVGILAHELFHVFSRHNEKVRNDIYALFGFKKCNSIDVAPTLQQRNITNPDCPVYNHYITVDGRDFIIILYSHRDYTGGNVFEEYVSVSLLELEGNDMHKQPKMNNGEPVIVEFQDLIEIFQQLGTNTDYIIHPEEISAEHFTFLITGKKVRQQEYVEGLKKVLLQ